VPAVTHTICNQCNGVFPPGAPYIANVGGTLKLTSGEEPFPNLDFCCTDHLTAHVQAQPTIATPEPPYPAMPASCSNSPLLAREGDWRKTTVHQHTRAYGCRGLRAHVRGAARGLHPPGEARRATQASRSCSLGTSEQNPTRQVRSVWTPVILCPPSARDAGPR
jgi:hypothetical protein